jgi:uncharacterized heparinase superfamily protein
MFSKQRVIVDSGVFEYEAGDMREYVRSTAAHNTISVDGAEQSEIWGAFRVGRRALKLSATINEIRGGVHFSGRFRGFPAVSGKIEHERRATIWVSDDHMTIQRISIDDHINGKGRHAIESFIHVHPELDVIDMGNGTVELLCKQRLIATIDIPGTQDYSIDSAFYCPEFGIRNPNAVIVIRQQGELPMGLKYDILNCVSQ